LATKPKETYWLADGLHRLQEAMLNGWKTVDVAWKEDGKLKTAKIDPKDIKIPPIRVTSVWTEEDYKNFQANLKAAGIDQPIIVTRDIIEAKVRNLYLNRMRGRTRLSEEVAVINSLSVDDGLTVGQIEEKTGFKPDQIEQRLAIGRASDNVKDAVEEERIGIGVAFQLSRLPNHEGQDRLLFGMLQRIQPWTTKEVEQIVNDSLEIIRQIQQGQTKPDVPIPVRTLKCAICEQKYEPDELRGINVCSTCIGLSKDYIQGKLRAQTTKPTPEKVLAAKIAEDSLKGEGES